MAPWIGCDPLRHIPRAEDHPADDSARTSRFVCRHIALGVFVASVSLAPPNDQLIGLAPQRMMLNRSEAGALRRLLSSLLHGASRCCRNELLSIEACHHLDSCLICQLLNLLFKALRDPTRRRILEKLKRRDLTAGEIASCFDMTAPSISHHLDLLKQAQLVSARKKGQFIVYSLETTALDESIGWILDLIRKGKVNAKKTKSR
jgi:DNA-binding transcriptional ArsR family regulator